MAGKAKCPVCCGPVEAVRRWDDGTVAYRCIRGHKVKSMYGEVSVKYPVYLVEEGHPKKR
jgi:hypothetical protein